jgi:class 3 adenylate cyclase
LRRPPFPWQLTGVPSNFITRRLRHLIIIPYLILATLLALTVTTLLLSAANKSLTDRFNAQLLDAAQGGAARLTQVEDQQLQALRAIIFTRGFAEAIANRDSAALQALAAPQAANYDLDSVIVVSKDRRTLLLLPQPAGGSASAAISPELDAIIGAGLAPSSALDNVSAPVEGSQGNGLFYTAGPVRQGEQIIGAVLVGSNLSRLLKQIGRDSLSDGVTFYGPAGTPLGYTLAASRQEGVASVPSALPAGWYAEISAHPKDKVRVRTVTLDNETYVEALGPVLGNGLQGQPPGVYGVMLRTQTLDASLEQTLWSMLPIFALALGLTVIIGIVLANWIDRPLTQLMIASGRVARGDLSVQVPVTRNDELGVLANRFNDMVDGLRQLLFVKDLFGRFVSPEVSAKLLAGQIELGGEQREVTILFSDLRDFTRLSEERSPSEIVDLLNEYFQKVVQAARHHGGIVNKFGGDSTLIIFGAPVDMPDHADRALMAALEMDEALEAMSARRVSEGWEPLRQGIGINTGMVVAGQIGSEDRMEYTVIGDTVNVASRLQAMTKRMRTTGEPALSLRRDEGEGGTEIVFSASTMEALTDPEAWRWESKGSVEVRGKHEGVSIYRLIGESKPRTATSDTGPDEEPERSEVDGKREVVIPDLEASGVRR